MEDDAENIGSLSKSLFSFTYPDNDKFLLCKKLENQGVYIRTKKKPGGGLSGRTITAIVLISVFLCIIIGISVCCCRRCGFAAYKRRKRWEQRSLWS